MAADQQEGNGRAAHEQKQGRGEARDVFAGHQQLAAQRRQVGARKDRSLSSANGLRMNGCDPFVTTKILHVERENPIEPMDLHGGHEACVVHLCTNDVVLEYEPPPLTKGLHRIGQDQEHSLEPAGISVSRGYAEPKAVHHRGSCAHIPELSHVLGCHAQDMLFSVERLNRMYRHSRRGVAALNSAHQNIRVQQYPHL
jgi:hypothetical protein